MSSRQVRRAREALLRAHQEQVLLDGDGEGDVASSEEEEDARRGKSGFAALLGSDSESESEADSESDACDNVVVADNAASQERLKSKCPSNHVDAHVDDELLLEKAAREAEAARQKLKAEDSKSGASAFMDNLLAVNVALLNPFGASASSSEATSSKRHKTRRERKGKGNVLVTLDPRDAFPVPKFASGRGVRMLLVSPPGTFRFEISDDYRARTATFEATLETHDPRALIDMFRSGGFENHIETLLSLYNIFCQFGRYAEADFYIRRALFVAESYFHPRFVSLVAEGKARILGDKSNFSVSVLRCLRHRARSCSKQGFHKAAFAMLKLVFALDPEGDPCGALLDLDIYAIKAGDSEFVAKACDSMNLVDRLPNFAMAKWSVSGDDKCAIGMVHKFPGLLSAMAATACESNNPDPNVVLLSRWCNAVGADARPDRLDSYLAKRENAGAVYAPLLGRIAKYIPEARTFSAAASSTAVADTRKKYTALSQSGDFVESGQLPEEMLQEHVQRNATQLRQQRPNVDMDANLLSLFFRTMMPWSVLPERQQQQDGGSTEDE